MSHTAAEYMRRLAAMLPPGRIDWLAIDARTGRLLAGLGTTCARVESEAIDAFVRDAIPTRCEGDALAAWETACGLPDLDRPPVNPTDIPGRQAEVGRALAAGQTPTLDLLAAQAEVWDLTATAEEYTGFPCEVWILGPPDHVKAFRVGTSHVGDLLLYQSEIWRHVMRLAGKIVQAHVKLHTADDLS